MADYVWRGWEGLKSIRITSDNHPPVAGYRTVAATVHAFSSGFRVFLKHYI